MRASSVHTVHRFLTSQRQSGRLWGTQGSATGSEIVRAALDGPGAGSLIAWIHVSDPADIAVDSNGARLCWGQGAGTGSRIRCANLDCAGAETVLSWPQVTIR